MFRGRASGATCGRGRSSTVPPTISASVCTSREQRQQSRRQQSTCTSGVSTARPRRRSCRSWNSASQAACARSCPSTRRRSASPWSTTTRSLSTLGTPQQTGPSRATSRFRPKTWASTLRAACGRPTSDRMPPASPLGTCRRASTSTSPRALR